MYIFIFGEETQAKLSPPKQWAFLGIVLPNCRSSYLADQWFLLSCVSACWPGTEQNVLYQKSDQQFSSIVWFSFICLSAGRALVAAIPYEPHVTLMSPFPGWQGHQTGSRVGNVTGQAAGLQCHWTGIRVGNVTGEAAGLAMSLERQQGCAGRRSWWILVPALGGSCQAGITAAHVPDLPCKWTNIPSHRTCCLVTSHGQASCRLDEVCNEEEEEVSVCGFVQSGRLVSLAPVLCFLWGSMYSVPQV